jgi:hypothetical protein
MNTQRALDYLFLPAALILSGLQASAEDASSSNPLVQVAFDRLIPSAYPTIQVNFNRLRQTNFTGLVPSSYPTAQTNFSRLYETTFNRLVPSSYLPTSTTILVGSAMR